MLERNIDEFLEMLRSLQPSWMADSLCREPAYKDLPWSGATPGQSDRCWSPPLWPGRSTPIADGGWFDPDCRRPPLKHRRMPQCGACRNRLAKWCKANGVTASRFIAVKCVSVCHRCLVESECLWFAVDRPELVGCWGGTSDAERVLIRRRLAA